VKEPNDDKIRDSGAKKTHSTEDSKQSPKPGSARFGARFGKTKNKKDSWAIKGNRKLSVQTVYKFIYRLRL